MVEVGTAWRKLVEELDKMTARTSCKRDDATCARHVARCATRSVIRRRCCAMFVVGDELACNLPTPANNISMYFGAEAPGKMLARSRFTTLLERHLSWPNVR